MEKYVCDIMGDFNAIRLHFEAFGGCHVPGDMEEFDLAVSEADLVEIAVQGNWFTWTSKVHGSGLMRRLNCIMVNDDWLAAWPSSRVSILPWVFVITLLFYYILAFNRVRGWYHFISLYIGLRIFLLLMLSLLFGLAMQMFIL